MDKESPELHFECLCRTCMHEVPEATIIASNSNQPAQQQWQYIFNTVDECDSMRITDLLVRIMPQLQLNFSKQLPQRICKLCLEYLLNAYRFQQMCLQSEQQLHDLVAKRRLDVKLMTTEIEVESKISILSEGVEPEAIEASYTPNVAISIEDPLQNSNINVVTNKTDIYLKTEQSDDEYDCCNYALKGAVERTGLADGPHIKIEIDTHTDVLEIEARTTSDEVSNHGDAGDSDWVINKTTLRSKKECSNEKKLTKVLLDNPLNEKTEEASPTYDCNLCKKSFNIRGYLLKHLRRHKRAEDKNSSPTPKRFECEICGNYYNKQESFEKHKQLHRSDAEKSAAAVKNFTCKFCENKYGTQPVLKRHMRQKHGEQYSGTADKRYTCEVCDKSYKQSTTLKDHMRTHTGEQPYLCSECGKAFNSLSNMKQHLLRHGGDKPYECPDCPKKFPTISDLASHKVMHRQIKPHVCDICGNAFGKAYQLKKHKMYHNGEKPHKCEYCEMRFVCKDHQRRHMRTHTGEKPYKCKYCERAFAQSNDLIKHLRTHLGENVYKCELCPNSFRLASELRVHFAEHKHDDEETRTRNRQALADEEAKLRVGSKLGKC